MSLMTEQDGANEIPQSDKPGTVHFHAASLR
jgi:hypothetical protein